MAQYNNALNSGEYDSALDLGTQVLGLYNESEDSKRIGLIGDPEANTKMRAKNDGESYKAKSLAMLDKRELGEGKKMAMAAKSCMEWSGDSTASITDTLSVIKLAEVLWKSDSVLEKCKELNTGGDRSLAVETLSSARGLIIKTQEIYCALMERAARMLADEGGEEDPVLALELQTTIAKVCVCVCGERSEAKRSEAKRSEAKRSEAKRSEAKRSEAKRDGVAGTKLYFVAGSLRSRLASLTTIAQFHS